jgi:class 3 adenylate cyclase
LEVLAFARGGSLQAAKKGLVGLLEAPGLDDRLRIDVLSMEGRLYKDQYARTRNGPGKRKWAALSAAAYRNAAAQPGADFFPTINAATMTYLEGKVKEARRLARSAIGQARQALRQPGGKMDYWIPATLGEAHILLGEFDTAATGYGGAVEVAREQGALGDIISMRRNVLLLKEKLKIREDIMSLLDVGSVVAFAGHMLDHPERATRDGLPPRFPPHPTLLRLVTDAIESALDELNATVGYCSLACGSDMLFAECMLRRGAKLHIVLPFDKTDFLATSVDFGSCEPSKWRTTFDYILNHAAEVHYATKEPYLGHDVLFDIVNSFTQGLTLLRAQEWGVVPQALAVVDPEARSQRGGTQYFLETWRNAGHPKPRTIDLHKLRHEAVVQAPAAPPAPPQAEPPGPKQSEERTLQSMLFADVQDYSKLPEKYAPEFHARFHRELAGVIKSLKTKPVYFRTAGDGLFLVFVRVADCAEAAMRLLDRAERLPWSKWNFRVTTPLRIGVHAGPVFSGEDLIMGGNGFFGSHVNRAARIEPVTIPGCAYASEQFAALLAVEAPKRFACEYVGIEQLPKNFDDHCPLYRLARR